MAAPLKPAEREDRRRKVAFLLVAGATTNQIAENVGCSRITALADSKFIRAEWARSRLEAYDRYTAEQLVILAELQRANWQAAMSGDTRASTIVLRVCDQRAKLLGLYSPLKFDVRDEQLQS